MDEPEAEQESINAIEEVVTELMTPNSEFGTVFELQDQLKLAYEMDLSTGRRTYFFVVSWLPFLLNAIFIGMEMIDRLLKLAHWNGLCVKHKEIVEDPAAVSIYASAERTHRNVCTQTSGHYAWKSSRPCVTDLKNDKAHGVWDVLDWKAESSTFGSTRMSENAGDVAVPATSEDV